MSCPFRAGPSRRGLLAAASTLLVAPGSASALADAPASDVEPFHGPHQAGIATPQQRHCYVLALDLTTTKPDDVIAMLRAWTEAAARMTGGQTARPPGDDLAGDGGAALGLAPARLTLTFGFGPGLFVKDGTDRYGLAAGRPAPLVELPKFNGDQLDPARSGGDLVVQACAEDPQVAFHAVRELVRLAYGHAAPRWAQSGFLPDTPAGQTPRNLMGFKDGTMGPDRARYDSVVWAGEEAPAWLRGGSYLVVRRIRISLEHWDRTEVDFQEEVIGRHKASGAPIGRTVETDPLGLDRMDQDGNPVIAENAHVRLGAPEANDGAEILRRGYAYNDGLSFTAERWPPWRQGMLYDAGLLFLAYQRNPQTGFIRIYETMAKLDALNQFVTHVGSGLFACPGGVREGAFIGQGLFDTKS